VNNAAMNEQKMKDLWSHLHWLTVLAQQGSYTAAAARLGVSKSAMSQRISELEQIAATPLVRRTTRSVRLTEAGQQLVDETRGAFERIAQSLDQVSDLADTTRGLLRVTAPVAFARQHLVPTLADFLHKYPGVRLELDLSDQLRSLATDGFDLAIRHTALPPDTHVAWALCKTQCELVASSAYLRRHGMPMTPADLTTHNCLHYPREHDLPAWTFEPLTRGRAKRAEQRVTVQVAGSYSANNSEALRDAALAGLGIALLPDFSAQAALRAGKLIQVLPDWIPTGSFAEQLYVIRPYSTQVPRVVTAFVAFLRETFAAGFSDAA